MRARRRYGHNITALLRVAFPNELPVTQIMLQNLGLAARLRAEAWLARTFLKAMVPPKSGSIVISTAGNEAVAVWRTRGAIQVLQIISSCPPFTWNGLLIYV